jgi:hypothetical protein
MSRMVRQLKKSECTVRLGRAQPGVGGEVAGSAHRRNGRLPAVANGRPTLPIKRPTFASGNTAELIE